MAARHNLVLNPSFEYDAVDHPHPEKWHNFGTPAGLVRKIVDSESKNRSKSFLFQMDSGTADCGAENSEFPCVVQAGKNYTVSLWVKTNLSTGGAKLTVKVFKDGYAGERNYQSNTITRVTGWTRLSITITVPTDYTILEVLLCAGAYTSAFTGQIWFDSVMVEDSSSLGDYFDGADYYGSWDGAAELSTSTYDIDPVVGTDPKEYLLPNRRAKIDFGFADEYIASFSGRSMFPEVDVKSKYANFHFFDELDYLAESKLSGGSLVVDVRTDRYIWGILDYVYSDYFEVLATCDVAESWTNGADETDNQRGGDGCQKITSTGTEVKGYKTITSASWSGSKTHLDLFLYLSSLADLDYCKLRLETTADSAYYEINLETYGIVSGWNQLHLVPSDFTKVGAGDLTHIVRITFVHKADTAKTVYVLVDEIRLTMGSGYPQRIFDTGIQSIPIAWWAGNTSLYEIKTACEAEGARFYSDENGVLRFENRQHYVLNPEFKESKWSFTFNEITDLNYIGKVNDIINRVVVHLRPRRISAEKEIWRYGFVPTVSAGVTKTIWADFIDPCPTTVAGIVTPEATTDYTANTAENGSGTDKTANVSVSITKFANAAKLDITNNDAGTVYITLLKIRGTPAEESDESRVIVEDTASISIYDEKPSGGYEIDNKYMADESYAETVAQQILDWYSSPVRRITLKNRCVPQLQIGDMISVNNDDIGENYLVRITGIKITFSEEDGFQQEISTRCITNFETLSYFTIGTSEISGVDVIAP